MKKILISILFSVATILQAQYHVTTTGAPGGDGTINNPWDLTTAFNATGVVQPGETVYLHGGTYQGAFRCKLSGSSGNHITIRPYNFERVIIDVNGVDDDGAIVLDGAFVIIRDLEMINSYTERIDTDPRTLPRTRGVYVNAPDCKVINCLIYDNNQTAVGVFAQASRCEFYGNIVCNNGNISPEGPSGHGFYSQSVEDFHTIKDNIFFNSMQYGFHLYTEGGTIKGFRISGNVIFNSGALGGEGIYNVNMLLGGKQQPGGNAIYEDNHFRHPMTGSKNVQFGYHGPNEDMIFRNNYITGGSSSLIVSDWTHLTVTGNRIVGTGYMGVFSQDEITPVLKDWDNNSYYYTSGGVFSFINEGVGANWTTWRTGTGFDSNSTMTTANPSANEIVLRANYYEVGRGNLVIYNWENLASVPVNLSSVVPNGSDFYVYDVENITGSPIAEGTNYQGGSVSVPMNLTTVYDPVGNYPFTPPHTSQDFGTFLIMPREFGVDSPIIPQALQEQITAATPGTTITLDKAGYSDNLTIDCSGTAENVITITGDVTAPNLSGHIDITGSYVSVTGIEFSGDVDASTGVNITLEDNIFSGTGEVLTMTFPATDWRGLTWNVSNNTFNNRNSITINGLSWPYFKSNRKYWHVASDNVFNP